MTWDKRGPLFPEAQQDGNKGPEKRNACQSSGGPLAQSLTTIASALGAVGSLR
ncbi:MAG: hypothetical protein Kow00106_02540 [Anaerolineae bacterium]